MENKSSGVDRSRAVSIRDAALARVRLTRRWVIAGAATLTAGFAALVSAVAPGHSLSSKGADPTVASAAGNSASAIPSMPAPAGAGDLGLQSPGQVPTPDQSQPSSPPSRPSSPPSQASSPPSQPQSQPSQPQSVPSAPPSSGGGVVSGGS
jgi:hypothetical protein